jgi:hypothetical protein
MDGRVLGLLATSLVLELVAFLAPGLPRVFAQVVCANRDDTSAGCRKARVQALRQSNDVFERLVSESLPKALSVAEAAEVRRYHAWLMASTKKLRAFGG